MLDLSGKSLNVQEEDIVKVVSKSAKNLMVGDFIALSVSGWDSHKYPAGKNRMDESTSFVEIVSIGELYKSNHGEKYIDITCADGGTYHVESSACRYATEVK